MIRPVVAVLQGDSHQPPAVPFSSADQGPSRGSGVSGLHADAPGHRPQKPVMIGHGAPAHRNAPGGAQARKGVVPGGIDRQAGHIPGGGIMTVIVQAAGICKGRVLHPQLPGQAVHPPDEGSRSAAVVRQGRRRIVAGAQQQPI